MICSRVSCLPPGTLPLTGPDLARHRDLVTREATAVYLKDVLLTIPFPWPATGVELGDCQGSDSPFPQHLAQVLAYLVKSDLALYVVSSRVGLRQADFQFLAELKRMGLIPHILVLLNLDLGEHTSYAEVVKIRDRVAQELTSWQPDPRVYAFSALKLLLDRRQARGESLDPREAAVLQVWALDPDSAAFAESEAARFEADLKTILGDLRTRRLAGGSLAQVKMVARGLREQLELTQDLLARGLTAIKELEARLEARRQPLHATMATVSQTLEGAGHRLKKTLRSRVDTLLDRHSGPVGQDLSGFIDNFTPDWDQLAPPSAAPAFRPVLYQLFQEFAKALAQHVTNEANLTLVEFIREQEEWLRQELAHLWQPLFLNLQEALSLYYREIADLGLAAARAYPGGRGRGPAPGPGGASPEPGGGPGLAVCPGGLGGFRHGGFRPGLGRDQAPPEAGRGSGPPQATPPGPEAGPGGAQGLVRLRTGRPAPQLPGGLKIPVLLSPGGPVAEAPGSRPGRHPRVAPGKPQGRRTGHANGRNRPRRTPPTPGTTNPRSPPHRVRGWKPQEARPSLSGAGVSLGAGNHHGHTPFPGIPLTPHKSGPKERGLRTISNIFGGI